MTSLAVMLDRSTAQRHRLKRASAVDRGPIPTPENVGSRGCASLIAESHEALAWARALAGHRRARLRALAVDGPIAFGGMSTTGALGYPSANDALRRALARAPGTPR
jgi:hypothetical protein